MILSELSFYFQPRWKVPCVFKCKKFCGFWGPFCNRFTSQNWLVSWCKAVDICQNCWCGECINSLLKNLHLKDANLNIRKLWKSQIMVFVCALLLLTGQDFVVLLLCLIYQKQYKTFVQSAHDIFYPAKKKKLMISSVNLQWGSITYQPFWLEFFMECPYIGWGQYYCW